MSTKQQNLRNQDHRRLAKHFYPAQDAVKIQQGRPNSWKKGKGEGGCGEFVYN